MESAESSKRGNEKKRRSLANTEESRECCYTTNFGRGKATRCSRYYMPDFLRDAWRALLPWPRVRLKQAAFTVAGRKTVACCLLHHSAGLPPLGHRLLGNEAE